MKIFITLLSILALQGCITQGPYFKLNELENLVRDRYTQNEVLDEFGPANGKFADNVFSDKGNRPPSHERLLVQTIDDVVFSAVEAELEDDYNNMEFAPGELPKVASSAPAGDSDFRSHSSSTVEVNDCSKSRKSLRYISERNDPNGYTEKQYAILMLDPTGAVCGFKLRSMFTE